MPTYAAPVRDTLFVLNEVLGYERYSNLPGFSDASAGRARSDPRRRREARRKRHAAAEPRRRHGRLRAQRRRFGDHAEGLQGGIRPVPRRRLDGPCRACRIWRAGPALFGSFGRRRISVLGQHGADDVCRPDAGRDRRDPRPRHRRAEVDMAAEAGRGRLDRHHEPDRAALRHRSRPAAYEGRSQRRRQLQDLRPEDIHLRRRTRPGRKHRPSGAGPHRGRAAGRQGHLAVHRARSSSSTPPAIRATAMPSPAARSRRRWAYTAIRPAS